MSTEPNAPTPADSLPPSPSPGLLVREARERLNLSLDELAGMTRLSYNTLEALERDAFDALLEPVYIRGYYRKCAKVLDIPESALLQAYEQRVVPKSPLPPAKLRLASGSDWGSGTRLPIPRAIMVALAAILICAVLWIVRSQANRTASAEETTAGTVPVTAAADESAPDLSASAPVDTTPVPAADRASQEAVAAAPHLSTPLGVQADTNTLSPGIPPETAAPASAPSAPAAAPATPSATPAPPASETGPTAASAEPVLTLRFNGTSWARVTDANGKVLYDGLAQSGQSQTLSGEGPLALFIGNATVVQVEYRGSAIDLAPYIRSNKTARLTLPSTS